MDTLDGSVVLRDGVLCLHGEVDTQLVQLFQRCRPRFDDVRFVDATGVTFIGCAGLRLLAAVSPAAPVRLAASPLVLRLVHAVGMHGSFELEPADPASRPARLAAAG
ncbi:STAS domain-containing protein [Klenkia sp. PcliD-1-E]|uniref:STAS domain-containing protein n=1 Tax=Klenkia sp. PcliD-1-E TaxID=2954492 RepID=UPI00209780AE|nr:STAS domain-containing protein [Klenkia sp. PcliD-1-E]MCO7218286.1 STAS domain-containing protein [Klenkia sp. PcliD-1-E]